ncbi:hypothetical protein L2E82_36345 [Cichorium intybus]|uniref:Uncharacterized protein n=1 Tax=Cichorium intybus TaxID=13427 RepID=A0ACB9BRA3_CICIN|nr:hypothetical protein L2E82_36345 [Cichorium intybus]
MQGLPWHPLLSPENQRFHPSTNKLLPNSPRPNSIRVQAFRRSDFHGFPKRIASGEVWRDAWRSTNNGFEHLLSETKKTTEHINRQFSVARRLSSVAQSASDRARELDRDYLITQRWHTFTLNFSQNWPTESDICNMGIANCRPLLIGGVANNLVIKVTGLLLVNDKVAMRFILLNEMYPSSK